MERKCMPRLGKVGTNGLEDCDQESRYNVLSMRASTPGRSTYPSRRMGGGSTDNVTLDRRHIQEGNRGTLRREEMAIIFTDGADGLLALLATVVANWGGCRLPMPWQRNGSFVVVCFAVCQLSLLDLSRVSRKKRHNKTSFNNTFHLLSCLSPYDRISSSSLMKA